MSPEITIPHSRPTLLPEAEASLRAVLDSVHHAAGPLCSRFEEALGRRIGVRHGIATSSGFASLHLALLALGVRDGRPALVPSYVCAALLNAVAAAGGQPLVADVDPRFFNLTAETARDTLEREGLTESDVACAVVPHMFGFPAPLHLWELGIPVLEDCAMGLGARIGDDEVGSWGRLSVFSFYATKMISGGQGGLLATSDAELAGAVRDLMEYDNRARWKPSFNYSWTDLAAALALPQLQRLDELLRSRNAIAEGYRDACRGLPVTLQEIYPETTPCFYRFVLQVADSDTRERLERDLASHGIEAKSPVFKPLQRYLGLSPTHFPATKAIQERALSIPIYPSLTEEEQERVVAALQRFLG